MSNLSRIKSAHLQRRVAFGQSAARLYKRQDIDDLAILALESRNPKLLELFEYLPDLDTLKKKRVREKLTRAADPAHNQKMDDTEASKQGSGKEKQLPR